MNHQFVQALHAVHQVAALYAPGHGIPNMILIGLPDIGALRRASQKLKKHQIPHYEWPPKSVMNSEPECHFGGITAIATTPIDGEQKEVLKNYLVWREKPNEENAPARSIVNTAEQDCIKITLGTSVQLETVNGTME